MFGCQQVLIHADKNLEAILEFVCGESVKLSNCGTYYWTLDKKKIIRESQSRINE